MKTTALRFLLEYIAEEGKDMIGRDIIEQALNMEKNQIEDAFDAGQANFNPPIEFVFSEDYFECTYNN